MESGGRAGEARPFAFGRSIGFAGDGGRLKPGRGSSRNTTRRPGSAPGLIDISILPTSEANVRDPGLAALLSLLIPGVGQIYNGKILRGIFWLVITPGLWIGSGGVLGWMCHLISAYTAYNYAKAHPYR